MSKKYSNGWLIAIIAMIIIGSAEWLMGFSDEIYRENLNKIS